MQEKALLVAVQHGNQEEERFYSSLDELKALTETAEGTVVKVVTQKRDRIHPALYLGEGKVQEIHALVDEMEIDLVISNDGLSPGQQKNLVDKIGVRVLDRNQLILDIFAQRAHTKEGKLQVELAQYKYLLPRLYGQGLALSRLGAGIGTRGPGETKLETDRRHIQRRIDDIKHKLEAVVNQRAQYRKRRKENKAFQVAIVGYTNAGKSTIFNRLTKSESLEENQLFATLDPMTRQIILPSGFRVLLTDTVGFIEDLPTSLVAAFRSTLEEVTEADFILHMVDASHPDQMQHQQTVTRLLNELGAEKLPMLTVYNKKDLLTETFFPSFHPSITISALNSEDRKRVLTEIEEVITASWEEYEQIVPASNGKLLERLKRQTVILEQIFDDAEETYKVRGKIAPDHPLKYSMKVQVSSDNDGTISGES
ncbi:GTPase HflX [Aquibacillus sp. 3ASR75-11]|uniref:GTPase HflX n=1 Tax=Terrihalobacillus insolitus TaxID=2950438 RepID=A0A9X3WVW3_9BACI|nr:GTPase HflX [Terrihalobacillus insolitus]MDC3425788.1 GTPase HflX [Terrihalobacillus insolitus]